MGSEMCIRDRILLITVACIGLYVVLRSLPDSECGFLHYEISEVTSDGFEFCKGDSAVFLDLNKLKFPTTLELAPDEPLAVGKPTEVTARVLIGTKPIRPHEIAITHTQKLHLLIIDPTLEDYHHLHPTPDGMTGDWRFTFTPNKPGPYTAFAELVPMRTKRHVIGKNTLDAVSYTHLTLPTIYSV